jgi:outer membrane protein assembly factor BamD
MARSVTALAALALALVLGGCSLFGKVMDPRKDWQAADYYKAAKTEFDAENWDASIKIYDQLEAKFPFGRFAQQAALESAYAYYKTNDTAQCVSTLDKFIKAHPNHPNVDYALYLKALANFKEDLGPLSRMISQDLADRDPKAARESFEGFKDLVARFPDSRYVEDSRERMAYLVEALARHEVNVAKYYLQRRAYLAAANRAQETIARFPNSPTRRDALDVMIEAYDRMEMTELRDDAKKVLAKNYPSDPLAEAGKNRQRTWYKPWTYW